MSACLLPNLSKLDSWFVTSYCKQLSMLVFRTNGFAAAAAAAAAEVAVLAAAAAGAAVCSNC